MSLDPQAALNPQAVLSTENISADYRTNVEDFQVNEELGFTLTGSGEHVWLQVEKRSQNTAWVAGQIAELAAIRSRDVGFAGLKDRHAITTQWFSVCVPEKQEPDWRQLNNDNTTVLTHKRHNKKCRRGCLKGNHFQITLRNIKDDAQQLNSHLEFIRQHGVPNYFGPQRFGRQASNLHRAWEIYTNKKKRFKKSQLSLYYSAARSLLFNRILQERVRQQTWNKPLNGDVMMFDGGHSCFLYQEDDDSVSERVQSQQLHPTAALWGSGDMLTRHAVRELEMQLIDAEPVLREGLCKEGVKQMRRSLRLSPENFTWQCHQDTLDLSFYLPSGSFATAILNELATVNDVSAVV